VNVSTPRNTSIAARQAPWSTQRPLARRRMKRMVTTTPQTSGGAQTKERAVKPMIPARLPMMSRRYARRGLYS